MKVIKRIIFFIALMLCTAQLCCAQTYSEELVKQANAGDAISQFNLANCYFGGKGIKQDSIQAIYWYKKVIDGNRNNLLTLISAFSVANIYDNNKDYSEALQYYKIVVDKYDGNKDTENYYAIATFKIGDFYYGGLGVAKDYEKAIPWFEKATNLNSFYVGGASLKLGQCYENGWGVDKNADKALYYYNIASNDNVKFYSDCAKIYMASMYAKGDIVEKDLSKTFALLGDTKDLGDLADIAQLILGETYYNNTSIPENYEKAIKYFTMAKESTIKKLSGMACFYLSKCYRFGRGCETNITKADVLLEEAAQKGCTNATSVFDMLKTMF
ncbi:MAG: SEL1-like repeat protein [Prevotella sp.]|nr:SEL1-like repeat protein [Prevotella sp.]